MITITKGWYLLLSELKKNSELELIIKIKKKTVKNFVNMTAKKLSMNIIWKGKGLNEKAYDRNTGKIIIDLDKKFLRPTEVDFLKGNFSKARKLLKWKPKTSTEQLVDDMVKTELSN